MLILTRRLHESIVIGDDIVVKIVSVNGNQIGIGIEAPPNIEVDRQEIRERKKVNRKPPPKP